MKLKSDFVTNSSSVAFIIAGKDKILKKDLEFSFNRYESFRSFNVIEDLISYTQARKCDWIDKVRGAPKEFVELNSNEFYKMKKVISDGCWAYRVYIERNNWDRIEKFQRIISELPFETTIIMTESH